MQTNKLKNTLSTLTFLSNQATLLLASCHEVIHNKEKFKTHSLKENKSITLDKIIVTGLMNYYLIIINSFLDEWNDEFNPKKITEYSERILQTKKYTKPIFKRIDNWSGLKHYRNVVLAHNLRSKGGVSLFDSSQKLNYSIPSNFTELVLLNTLINTAMQNTLEDFNDIKINTKKDVANIFQVKKIKMDLESELMLVLEEVELLKKNK